MVAARKITIASNPDAELWSMLAYYWFNQKPVNLKRSLAELCSARNEHSLALEDLEKSAAIAKERLA